MGNWLLPERLVDILPAEARRIEELRRELLDLYRTYGFELVAPPLVEYIDSLLSGTETDLDLRTSKLVDQLSGRTLGVRADMTPQVSRIDAHLLNRAGVTRLCYCGTVLHARPVDLLSNRMLALRRISKSFVSCLIRSRSLAYGSLISIFAIQA
jgi:ATP phosphoribosyltransferase regulatory subunit